jgi:outer membrane lipoprotein carrier protein
MIYKFFLRCAVLAWISLVFAVPAAQAQSVQERVAAIEQHYSSVQSLTAKVVQKNRLKAINRTQTFDGALRIKKPGKLRLDFSNGQMILVDGTTAQLYSKKSEQLIKKTFADVQEMNVPVAFLLGAARIRDDFDVLPSDSGGPGALELLPKKQTATMRKLVLRTDADARITGMTIFDKAGNTTEIAFSDMRENVEIDDNIFRFKAPKGTEIIEQ